MCVASDPLPDSTREPAATTDAAAAEDESEELGVRGRLLFGVAQPHRAEADDGRPSPTRVRVTSAVPPRSHPLPVPNGWYAATRSSALGPRHIVSLTAVGRELVIFRDDNNAAHVLDAHCPHFGAHLGAGWIADDRLACPYHGWEFDGTGGCRYIPFHDGPIPSRARVRSYPTVEQDGFVWFWYHSADGEPDYELPAVSEVDDPDWTEAFPFDTDLVAALQEMAENNVDYAHFNFVHRANKMPLLSSTFTTDGPTARVVEELAGGLQFSRDVCGPGFAVLRLPNTLTVLAGTTPIDRGTCRLQWNFHFPESMRDMAHELVATVTGEYGLQADIPIWADKVYRERPVMVKTDAAIAQFRRWYAQFYDTSAAQHAEADKEA